MDELTPDQITRLENDVNTANIMRGFIAHPGFAIYKAALDAIVEDKKKAWLKGSDEDARLERIRAQGVEKAIEVLKQYVLLGNNAARILNGQVDKVAE